jgi:hypothetical protein
MYPSVPIPTDNIYKFACLFGLALIVSSIFAFFSYYDSALDRKVKYAEAIVTLEAKEQRTVVEEHTLAMSRKIFETTQSNETWVNNALYVVLTFGLVVSIGGAERWYRLIQSRDDKLASLQIAKLEAEIAALNAQASPSSPPCA